MTEQSEQSQPTLAGRIFRAYARENLPEMKLLFREGKLSPKLGEWNNVINHSLVQAAAGEIVTTILEIPQQEASTLFKTILVHDWGKRHDKKPDHFTEDEWKKAEEFASKINYDPSVLETTDPGFHDRIIAGEATFLQKLQYYIDDITKGEDIATFENRIAEVSARRPEFSEGFWVKELEAGKMVEQEIFQLLRDKGVKLERPEDIPDWLKKQLETKYGVLNKQEEKGEVIEVEVSTLSEKQVESGERKNEDTVKVKENEEVLVAAVVDGGSALSSITTIEGKERFSGLFVSQGAVDYIEEQYSQSRSAKELIILINQKIASELKNRGVDPETASSLELPTASGASIVRIDKKTRTVEVVQVGDTAVLLVWDDGHVGLACPVDTPKEDVEAIRLAQEIAGQRKIPLKEALKDKSIGDLFIRSRSNENSPDGTGTGALNGRKSMENYISRGVWPLENLKMIIMLTDGLFLPQKDSLVPSDWEEVAWVVERFGLEGLYDRINGLKSSDPDLSMFPRAKQYDDATGVVIKLDKAI